MCFLTSAMCILYKNISGYMQPRFKKVCKSRKDKLHDKSNMAFSVIDTSVFNTNRLNLIKATNK